ncbi:MAG: sugar phosphate isomerase/epimerase [Alphaproteobacteria bacterium]|nr:MAG: sugar phosphate isomerase/epimerase [Alphaproteobacteria bacterium]
MNLRDRIGVDIGSKLPLEEAVEWAARHRVRFIDVQLDTGANALSTIDEARATTARAACHKRDIRLGLHTASAVNVAEYAPHVGDAVERYLKAYVDAAVKLGAGWIVMHAGFHFTSDKEQRMLAGRERLQRVADYAERNGALILLENLNKEPEQAEVHYLAHTVEEWRFYFDAILVEALDMDRVEEVRLADCFRNGHEVHLPPGKGNLDFGDMFRSIEGNGFRGHYMNAFGSLDDMLQGRDELVRIAATAGIA